MTIISHNHMQIGIIVVALAIVAAGVAFFMGGSHGSAPAATDSAPLTQSEADANTPAADAAGSTPTPQATNTVGATTARSASYKDGTYTETGNYRSPAGPESITVTLTLKDGTITDANVVDNATVPKSIRMQGQFTEGFKEQVVGKPIDEVALTVVNGSSLTPKGFMDALTKIETDAQEQAPTATTQ